MLFTTIRKTVMLVSLLIAMLAGVGIAAAAAQPAPRTGITPGLQRMLAEQGGPQRVWVFLTDKGLTAAGARQAAIDSITASYNPRAIERRRLRGDAARQGQALFGFQDIPMHEPFVSALADTGARIRIRSKWLNAVSVVATADQIEAMAVLPFVTKLQLVAKASAPEPLPDGQDVEPPAARAGRGVLDYGRSAAQLTQIDVIALHQAGFTGRGIIIGILDTGFRRDHDAFNQPGHEVNVIAEYDFVDDDADTSNQFGDPASQHDHGTKILGTIGSYFPGELVGGAFEASFVLAKTEDTLDEYQGEEDNYVAGLEFIEANGADLATSSLGYIDWYTQADLDGLTAVTTIVVNTASSLGLHTVNAAGNSGHDSNPVTSTLIAPSDALRVITVGAVTSSGLTSSFSSEGPTADGRVKPEVLALGSSTATISSSSATGFTTASGTSLSTPLVAAALGCLIQARPTWSVDMLREQLFRNADHDPGGFGFDPLYVRGYGIIAAAATHQNASGILVSPGTDLIIEGPLGGPFSPANGLYTVQNNGEAALDYLVSADQSWVTIVNGAGSLAAASSVDVTLELNAQADLLAQGHYEALITFENLTDSDGDTQRLIVLDVARTIIGVTPEIDLSATGSLGGPFPAIQKYTVTNLRPTAVEVLVTADQPWIMLNSQAGTIPVTLEAEGDSTNVFVGIASLASVLDEGDYAGNVSVTNATSGEGSATRAVALTVGGPQPVHVQNLDADPGWDVTGQWAFGQPTGAGSHDGDPASGFSGANVYGYNLAGDYVDNMPEYSLTSTAFDCSAMASVNVGFKRWLGVESATYDHASFQVGINGLDWTTLWSNAAVSGSLSDSSWNDVSYDIATIADHQSTVYLRWLIGTTDGSVTYPGWNIDDVVLLGILQQQRLSLLLDDTLLSWTPRPEILAHDMVRGDLGSLRASGGDFTLASVQCLLNEFLGTFSNDTDIPASGEGYWYLLRGRTADGPGSYESLGGNQAGLRDTEILASGSDCP